MTRDIHDYSGRYVRALRVLREDDELLEGNRGAIVRFAEYCQAEGLKAPTIAKHITALRKLSKRLGKGFRDATKDDMVRAVADIERSALSDDTKRNEKISIKRFYRWLYGDGDLPDVVSWIRARRRRRRIPPEQLLTEEEVKRMAEAALNQRDRAFVLALYETGARIGELLSLTIGKVRFDQYGAVLHVDGKTGPRRVRIIFSAPSLSEWLNHHPRKGDAHAPLWTSFAKAGTTEPLQYYACCKMLRELALRAGVRKRVNPHSFRHARASKLANSLTEAQMKEYLGWTQDSGMASVYVHLSGRDIDDALLRLGGAPGKEAQREEPVLRIRKCARCDLDNAPASRFCSKCGCALDLRTAMELQAQERRTDEVMDRLFEDGEFRRFLAERLGRMGSGPSLLSTPE